MGQDLTEGSRGHTLLGGMLALKPNKDGGRISTTLVTAPKIFCAAQNFRSGRRAPPETSAVAGRTRRCFNGGQLLFNGGERFRAERSSKVRPVWPGLKMKEQNRGKLKIEVIFVPGANPEFAHAPCVSLRRCQTRVDRCAAILAVWQHE
ncbi:hypothetical protein Bbelb_370530 [Branchiostoma belcheri]|nr:hypothetical protein Bbelb_370530 [Branchiostoma belcheri]